MAHIRLRAVISILAGSLVVAHLVWPSLQVDAVSLGLLALTILPWLTPLIKSAELPGGWKVEFQDVARAAEQITGANIDIASTGAMWAAPSAESTTLEHPFPSSAHLEDPNLAMVALRIEIEKRLRTLAQRTGLPATGSSQQLLRELSTAGTLSADQVGGLKAVIDAGNKAAHGASIDASVAEWTRTRGEDILNVLDTLIARAAPDAPA